MLKYFQTVMINGIDEKVKVGEFRGRQYQ